MLCGDMNVFDRLERRWGWLAFPGFLRYFALFQVLVFILQLFQPEIGRALAFDRDKILSGEIWRVATMFFSNGQFGAPNIMSILLLIFAVNFVFMVSDGLESAWGSFKASLFYYTGIILALVANFVYPMAIPYSGMTLFAASFLAFATLFPMVEILLFFVLPLQVRFLGMILAFGIVMTLVKFPILLPFFVLTFANYIIWAGIPVMRGNARVLDATKRRKIFNAANLPESDAFHTCIICKKTDVSDPHMEFRIGADGEEYCAEHLPE
ncbi:MAG: hypothetical protein ABIS50_14415 [Luteolibacter sp.]|uniref:hypothetical protein n=1 Tax=Luteolibacter sp. TaxID=1962973 RepID=UPI0032658E64